MVNENTAATLAPAKSLLSHALRCLPPTLAATAAAALLHASQHGLSWWTAVYATAAFVVIGIVCWRTID